MEMNHQKTYKKIRINEMNSKFFCTLFENFTIKVKYKSTSYLYRKIMELQSERFRLYKNLISLKCLPIFRID